METLKMNLINTRLSKQVIAKVREQQIKKLSYAELERCFKNVVAPNICIRRIKALIQDGLTIKDVYKN